MAINKSFKNSSRLRNYDFEDITALPRCNGVIVSARNKSTGRSEIFIVFNDQQKTSQRQ